jgi:hypothetical protein
MGCAGSKPKKQKYSKNQLGSALLKRLFSRLPKQTPVYIVRLKSAEGLVSPDGNLSGTADSFVELKMIPDDVIAGDQLQRSSNKPDTLNPKWIPPERFQFICNNKDSARIIFSIFSFHIRKERVQLGDAILNLKDLPIKVEGDFNNEARSVDKTLKIIDPETGKSHGTISVVVELLTCEEAVSIQEHTVYEYQRWQPIVYWGASRPGHLLPSDPGKWSNDTGLRFGDAINEVAPPIPASFVITKNWYVLATEHDQDGWTYGPDFRSGQQWYDKQLSGQFVRRRQWVRELAGDLARASLVNQELVTNPMSVSTNDVK